MIEVRQAKLDDAKYISQLFRDRVEIWQRFNAEGQVESPPYEELTIYERWLHGGAWMSLETSAIFLSHLLRGGGIPIVAVQNRQIVGYLEGYIGIEPEPYGDYLHIGQFIANQKGVQEALLSYITQQAKRITVAFSSYDQDSAAFYSQYGFRELKQIRQYALPAQSGQSFYQAIEYKDTTYPKGWYMSIGREQSGRQHWEMLWYRLWDAISEITAQRTDRLKISAAGQEALVCYQQQLYSPRTANVYCWSPKPLTTQLLVAIKDWAYRQNYRTLILPVAAEVVKLLGADAEATPYQNTIYIRT